MLQSELPGFEDNDQHVLNSVCMSQDGACLQKDHLSLIVSAQRGGARVRGPQDYYRITTINVTSLMLHWRTVQSIVSDFIHIVETKVSPVEKGILEKAFQQSGWTTLWSELPPGAGTNGMKGRSGGCLILAANGWRVEERMQLELNNPEHCYVAGTFVNDVSGATSLQCCYYGHPSHKDRTRADFDRLSEIARHLQIDMCLAGDFNISDTDEDNLPSHDYLCDVDVSHAVMTNAEVHNTFFAGRVISRLDRIFVSQDLEQHLRAVHTLDEIFVPGHCALQAEFSHQAILQPVQVARPPLCSEHAPSPVPGFVEQAQVEWEEQLAQQLSIDALYEWWAVKWETYLRHRHRRDLHLPREKGLPAAVRQRHAVPMKPTLPLLLRRLGNYLNSLKKLHVQLQRGEPGQQEAWNAVVRGSKAMAHYYGTPTIEQFHSGEERDLAAHVVSATYDYYQRIWAAERRQLRHVAKQKWRAALAMNNGVNKATSRVIGKKYQASALPKIKTENAEVITQPLEVLRRAHLAWADYFERPDEHPTQEWRQQNIPDPPLRRFPLPPLTGQELKAAVAAKGKDTSPGVDSWHRSDLADLPLEAMNQMAALLSRMEQQGYMPTSLAAFWLALVPKGLEPSSVLSIRPISILSVLYRSYAAVRAAHVQPWAREVLHPAQLAYIRGRQVQPVLTQLNAEMDQAAFANEDLFILSLDTSKAFPSMGHSQVFSLLDSHGFPTELIQMMQQLHLQGAGRLRYGGQVVHHQQMRPCGGIHQGCPLSVLAFNILLKPMCQRVTEECDAQLIVFADDVAIKAKNYEDLIRALEIVTTHFRGLHFNLNEAKTQYWRHSGFAAHHTVLVNGVEVSAQPNITILGWQFGRPQKRESRPSSFIADLKKLAEDTAGLPMTTYHKTNAIAAIFYAAKAYCPWNCYLDKQVDISTARKHILQANLKHHVKGPRASVLLTVHALKGHAVDPQLAVLYRMIKIMGDASDIVLTVLQTAYDRDAPPTSLCSCLAHGLKRLGDALQEGWWSPATTAPVPLRAPERHFQQERARWLQ